MNMLKRCPEWASVIAASHNPRLVSWDPILSEACALFLAIYTAWSMGIPASLGWVFCVFFIAIGQAWRWHAKKTLEALRVSMSRIDTLCERVRQAAQGDTNE